MVDFKPEVVYIGRKPLRAYIERARYAYERDGVVEIGARGNLISRAILVALRVAPYPEHTTIGSSKMKGEDGKERDVPFILITIMRMAPPVPQVIEGAPIAIVSMSTPNTPTRIITHDGISHPV